MQIKKIEPLTGEERIVKIYNALNAGQRPTKLEKSRQPSQTIPDQNMTVRTLLDRHSRGLSLSGRDPVYQEFDNNGINPATLDLVDIQRMKLENEGKIEDLKHIAQYEKLERQKAFEAKKQAEEAKKIEAQNKQIDPSN